MSSITRSEEDGGQFWTTRCGDRVVHQDTEEHVALVLRVLGISEQTWRCLIETYAAAWRPDCRDLHVRAGLLGKAYSSCSSTNTKPGPATPFPCPVCRLGKIVPAFAKKVGITSANLEYGCCSFCGHGLLLSEPSAPHIYQGASYFAERRADGAGYHEYEREKIYREEKAGRLLNWICQAGGICSGRLLEVGSGLGFTRKAAQDRGFFTHGVDLNPYAAERALALYGMETFVGTLSDARKRGAVQAPYDLVLYQFVLEHLADPAAELQEVGRILGPGGKLVLMIPSIDALEVKVFGSSYRSFRSDHLHIFSRQSIGRLLCDADFTVVSIRTECNAHLLAGFYSRTELQHIYDSSAGPDMLVLAQGDKK